MEHRSDHRIQQLLAAHRENVTMLKGASVPRQEGDCDECHLNVHGMLASGPALEGANDDVKVLVRDHMGEHQMMMKGGGSLAELEAHDLIQSNQMAKKSDPRFPADIIPVP